MLFFIKLFTYFVHLKWHDSFVSPNLHKSLCILNLHSDENCTPNKILRVFNNLLMFIDIKFCKFMPGFLVSNKSGKRKGVKSKCIDICK